MQPVSKLAVAILLTCSATMSSAQMPGAPVLQNAWAAPGIVGAIDVSGGSDGSIYAAAASWAPASARFQLSGGLGIRSRAGSGSKGVYGVRAAIPFGGTAGAFGFGAFAGIGGESSSSGAADSAATTTIIPVGIALGWRHALGARGFSVYATPSYLFLGGGSSNGGLVRTAIGIDVGVSKTLGVTAGVDFGQSRVRAEGGPTGTSYGLGVSYAVGRR